MDTPEDNMLDVNSKEDLSDIDKIRNEILMQWQKMRISNNDIPDMEILSRYKYRLDQMSIDDLLEEHKTLNHLDKIYKSGSITYKSMDTPIPPDKSEIEISTNVVDEINAIQDAIKHGVLGAQGGVVGTQGGVGTTGQPGPIGTEGTEGVDGLDINNLPAEVSGKIKQIVFPRMTIKEFVLIYMQLDLDTKNIMLNSLMQHDRKDVCDILDKLEGLV